MFYLRIVAVCILSTALARGMENSGCPESKKLYPGDCRLFYKCVPLSDSTHAHVWVPSRCTAGLVYHPKLSRCVRPGNDWNCQHGDQDVSELPYYNDSEEDEEEESETLENFEMTTEYETDTQKNTQNFETTVPMFPEEYEMFDTYDPASSVLNAIEQDRVPLSVVDNTSIDQIGNQMYRLTQLINSLKASPTSETPSLQTKHEKVTPIVYSALPQKPPYRANPSRNSLFPYKSPDSLEYEINLLPTQLNKITAQLIMQTPLPNKQPTNLNLSAMSAVEDSEQAPPSSFIPISPNYTSTEHLVSVLFKKYLINNSFMDRGEYVKKSPILIPLTTTRKPEFASKQSYNSIIQLSSEHRLIPQKKRISTLPHTANGFYGKSCLNGVRLPNPTDCTRYFLCNSSTTALQSYTCPPNTAFNKFKRICDVAEYQRCVKRIDGYPEKEEIERHNEVPCDTQMCGGLRDFGEWKQNRFNCPGALQFCRKKQSCLPKSLCP